MTTTANRRIGSASSFRFKAELTTPDIGLNYSYNAEIEGSDDLSPINCSSATVVYSEETELTFSHNFNGQIENNNIKITLDNGVVIEGALDSHISDAVFSGSSTWVLKWVRKIFLAALVVVVIFKN